MKNTILKCIILIFLMTLKLHAGNQLAPLNQSSVINFELLDYIVKNTPNYSDKYFIILELFNHLIKKRPIVLVINHDQNFEDFLNIQEYQNDVFFIFLNEKKLDINNEQKNALYLKGNEEIFQYLPSNSLDSILLIEDPYQEVSHSLKMEKFFETSKFKDKLKEGGELIFNDMEYCLKFNIYNQHGFTAFSELDYSANMHNYTSYELDFCEYFKQVLLEKNKNLNNLNNTGYLQRLFIYTKMSINVTEAIIISS